MAWPTLRKYAFLIVPTLFGIGLTVTILNNPKIRYIMEDYFPSYGNITFFRYIKIK